MGAFLPKPGEITLSHLGVLFLDELPEFDRKVLEVLRQPLESKEIIISRAARQITYPANFQLIAAMNPCPCGYAFNQDSRCQCSPESIKRYQNRISGPLLDRIDLHIDVPPLKAQELQDPTPAEDSTAVRQRVIYAYEQQMQRQNCLNQALSPKQLEQFAILDDTSQRMIEMAQQRLNLSARAYHRVLRVARTIADLAQVNHHRVVVKKARCGAQTAAHVGLHGAGVGGFEEKRHQRQVGTFDVIGVRRVGLAHEYKAKRCKP